MLQIMNPQSFSEDFTCLRLGWMYLKSDTHSIPIDIFPILEHSYWVCTSFIQVRSMQQLGKDKFRYAEGLVSTFGYLIHHYLELVRKQQPQLATIRSGGLEMSECSLKRECELLTKTFRYTLLFQFLIFHQWAPQQNMILGLIFTKKNQFSKLFSELEMLEDIY